MKKKIFFIALILIVSFVFASRIVFIGDTNPDEIFLLKSWKKVYENYSPDVKTIETIKKYTKDVRAEVYFGTWCKDSKNNVPKLIKIFELLPEIKVKYTAIIWRTCDKSGIYKKMDLKRVPTIIFYKNGKEIGRIIENPVKTLEKDIFDILSK